MKTAEIIAIGNELLLGDVLDTNTNWLCRRITGLGGQVTRAVMVRDEVESIATEVRAVLGRTPDLLITTGGLGPTDDDLTLAAIAAALSVPLQTHPVALKLVQQRYQELAAQGYIESAEMTPARAKMAILPAGATPLPNRVGTAPGVFMQTGTTALICLPGVPTEMYDIVENALQDTLQSIFGHGAYAERRVTADCPDESVLAPLLRQVAARHPQAYIKSRARGFGPKATFLITLSMSGDATQEVKRELARVLDDLKCTLRAAGIAPRVEEGI